MEEMIYISVDGDPNLKAELFQHIQNAGLEVRTGGERVRGIVQPLDIIVALSSAGTLTVLYQIIAKVIEKNKDREITIELNGKKVVIKGHSLRDEKYFLNELLPLLKSQKKRVPKKKSS